MSIPEKKICKRCSMEKAASEFSRQVVKRVYGTYLYLHTYCKKCASRISVENSKNKPKIPKRVPLDAGHKVCKKCGVDKSSSEFGIVKPGRGDRFNRPSRCKACRASRNLQWHKDNVSRTRANRANWYASNKENVSKYNQRKHRQNPAERSRRFKEWSLKKGAPYHAAKARARIARKMNATPEWLSAIQLAEINEFYELAAAKSMQTGKKFEIDHIFPLKGEGFCGLHVPWNLQLLEKFENISKKNRFPRNYAHLFWGAA